MKPFCNLLLVVLDVGVSIAEGVEGSSLLTSSTTDGALLGAKIIDVLIVVGSAEVSLAFFMTHTFAHKLSNITQRI